jgi:poly(A) polymerase
MQTFNIKPSASIGTIKQVIRDAILDGHIKNNYDEAFELMLTTAASMGLKPVA